ncbi:MAG: Rrf2 family transcriptional regulator [Phycisphaerae bacterium]|nr:Rrf2 family transcriptional regulator [Phycisphaerae bacterium]MCZ2399089.1 Rrf2 family transcriptional regulator [Phycisphaerae bacterium]NUQ49354.1 Rrf2 family transcriptional regulator [Phycisphaerae bacterium]
MCTLISKTAEYAIHAALWLAAHPGQPWTAQSIANATNIPAGYLGKVLQLLGRGGLVHAQPGPGGGFLLARAPGQIDVLAIVRIADPLTRARHGSRGNDAAAPPQGLGVLQARLDRAIETIEEMLRTCTLADLLPGRDVGPSSGPAANGREGSADDLDGRNPSPEAADNAAASVAGDPPSHLKKGSEQ